MCSDKESPNRGDSNESIQYSIFNKKIKKKTSLYIVPNLQLRDFFQGTQERVRNNRGKRAIGISFLY